MIAVVAIIHFVFYIVGALLGLMILALIVSAILSWLVAFDVINLRNRFMASLVYFLERVTRPILRPFQKIVPVLGGVDITPVIAILVIMGVRNILLPAFETLLVGIVSGVAV
jgi:YggT family protein